MQYFVSYRIPVREFREEERTVIKGWRRQYTFLQACSKAGAVALVKRFVPVASNIKVEATDAE